jgi:hypothetical protein
MLNGSFEFVELEGDVAVFKELQCHQKFKKALAEACEATYPPALQLGSLAHDVVGR